MPQLGCRVARAPNAHAVRKAVSDDDLDIRGACESVHDRWHESRDQQGERWKEATVHRQMRDRNVAQQTDLVAPALHADDMARDQLADRLAGAIGVHGVCVHAPSA